MTQQDSEQKMPPEALAALQSGHKIEAIKIVRERLGLDLKTAKDMVDGLAVPAGKPAPEIIQKRAAPVVLPVVLGLSAVGMLYQASVFINAGSNTSYCATVTRGKYLLCSWAPAQAEALWGEGQGYIGSALFLLLLAAAVALMALACRRAGQGR